MGLRKATRTLLRGLRLAPILLGHRIFGVLRPGFKYLSSDAEVSVGKLKVVSFSLYGCSDRYLRGAVENVIAYGTLFPDWHLHFFVGDSVPESVIRELLDFPHTSVTRMRHFPEDASAASWRFLLVADAKAETVIFRDTDSRPSLRERAAVNEWLESQRQIHVMRDHEHHKHPVMAGMCGIRAFRDLRLVSDLLLSMLDHSYGSDQRFLDQVIYREYPDRILVHQDVPYFLDDAKVQVQPFPIAKSNGHFAGKGFEADGSPRRGH